MWTSFAAMVHRSIRGQWCKNCRTVPGFTPVEMLFIIPLFAAPRPLRLVIRDPQ